MILTESRMRENRTSGLMSGGEETQRGTRLRHRRVAKAAGNSDSLDLRPARLPSPTNVELPYPEDEWLLEEYRRPWLLVVIRRSIDNRWGQLTVIRLVVDCHDPRIG